MDQPGPDTTRIVNGVACTGHTGTWLAALLFLGLILFIANPEFTVIDDEIGRAHV